MTDGLYLSDKEARDRVWRKAERARLIAARLNMLAAEHQAASATIARTLISDLLPRIAPKIIGGYWPIRGEADCRPVLEAMIAQGACAALPAVTGKGLEFRAWSPGAAMEAGPMNIPQPATAEKVMPDCLLIALVGFDARNYRLGYGAGHYDRALASMNPKPVTIGVGFEFQRLPDIRPHRFDIPLDYVVTEAGVKTLA